MTLSQDHASTPDDLAPSESKFRQIRLPRTPTAQGLYWSNWKARWPVYAVGILAVLATNICEVAIPKVIQWLVDYLSTKKSPAWLTEPPFNRELSSAPHYWLIATLIAILVTMILTRVLWRISIGQETHRITATLKHALWDRARFFPIYRVTQDLNPGQLMTMSTSDIGKARLIYGWILVGTTDLIFLGSLSIIAMFSIHPQLAWICISVLIVIPPILHRLSRIEERQHVIAQNSLEQLNHMCAQTIESVRLAKVTASAMFWYQKLVNFGQDYRIKRQAVALTANQFGLVMGLAPLASLALLFLFGLRELELQTLTVGEFIAMQSYVFLLQGPLAELGFIISEWQEGYTSLKRLAHTLSQEEEQGLRGPPSSAQSPHSASLDEPSLSTQHLLSARALEISSAPVISIKNLSFRYPTDSRPLITDITLSIPLGERVGITGPIGAGKSTLLSLLAGLETRYQGKIELWGRDLTRWTHSELRKKMIMVPQRSFLFSQTIRSNLQLDQTFSDDELWQALNWAAIADEVKAWDQGLDTPIGEWGINLSGGQKQRMTLARALLRRPELLLLDDCLSAVDAGTEDHILSQLNEVLPMTTVVWVAHRETTLQNCHKVITLQHGGSLKLIREVTPQGSPHD